MNMPVSSSTHLVAGQPILRVENLGADFIRADGSHAHAIQNVSFDLVPGQTLGLVGESGCGKTTTMLSILRLLPSNGRITSGKVMMDGIDLLDLDEPGMRRYRWKEIAIVFQSAMNALNPVQKVGDQVREAILHHKILDPQAANRRVDELFDLVGIALSRKNQYPHQYSGGMRQRAMIAMALACYPRILFADEPTTALDVMIQAQILELLRKIQKTLGLAVILVTHDLGVVAEVCDSAIVMYGGKVAEYGPVDSIFNSPAHPYTRRLLQAFPNIENQGERLVSIPGTPPALHALPPGCRFEPRCDVRIDICRYRSPDLLRVETGVPVDNNSHQNHLAACHLLPQHDGGEK